MRRQGLTQGSPPVLHTLYLSSTSAVYLYFSARTAQLYCIENGLLRRQNFSLSSAYEAAGPDLRITSPPLYLHCITIVFALYHKGICAVSQIYLFCITNVLTLYHKCIYSVSQMYLLCIYVFELYQTGPKRIYSVPQICSYKFAVTNVIQM